MQVGADRLTSVDWSTKGFWLPAGDGVPSREFVAAGHTLFDGPFSWPVMVARRSAIEANIATMAAYCDRHGVAFAPHGKTTMAPSLFAAQVAAGAWAITVATPHQALVARRCGVPRVLLANEVLDPRVLRWAAEQVAAGWSFLCYVDSLDGVAVLADAVAGNSSALQVLVELGYPGGRTGCRDVAAILEVAKAVERTAGVELAGVAAFEGLLPDADAVDGLMSSLVAAAEAVAPLCPGVPIISAGGSRFFDAVIQRLVPAARDRWRVLLRSGAVVTHDDVAYAESTPFRRAPEEGSLFAALEVWAQVLSTPEPGLYLLGAGKRDLPYDLGLPVALRARAADGAIRPLAQVCIDGLNDQHAYLRCQADLRAGDLVQLGISHPCAAFDRWRVIPVVTDDYQIVDLLHTYF